MQINSINIAEMFEFVHENWNVTIEMKVVEQWFEQRSQLVLLSLFHKRSAFVSFEDVRHFYFCFYFDLMYFRWQGRLQVPRSRGSVFV